MSRPDEARSGMRRLGSGIVGIVLIAVGVLGLIATVPTSARAGAASDGESHTLMHEMMDAMHGEGTAERMHEIEGVDEMMDQCAGMMDTMGGMSNMMRGMSNGGMMDGGGSGMRRMMAR